MSTQPAERLFGDNGPAEQAPLHIVLIEPRIPPNTGNVARLCAATGCALHLVEPLGFSIEDRELKRAGLDYWAAVTIRVHTSLEAFLQSTHGRRRWYIETGGAKTYREAVFSHGDFLVFGPETLGLPSYLLEGQGEYVLSIPMRTTHVRSLNLSTAVGVVAFEALAQLGFPL